MGYKPKPKGEEMGKLLQDSFQVRERERERENIDGL